MRSGHRKRSVGRVRPARNLWMELSLCGAHGAWSSQRARFALRVSLSGGCVRRGPACVPLRRVSVCVSRVATLGPEREATMGDLMCYVVLSVRPSGCTAAAARTLTTRACGVKTVSKLVNLTRRDRRAPGRTERAPDRPTDNRISWGRGKGRNDSTVGDEHHTSTSDDARCEEPPSLASHDPESLLGLKVILTGLVGRADLNGRTGIACSFDQSAGRLGIVGVTASTLAVKPDNLSLTATSQEALITKGSMASSEELAELFHTFAPEQNIEELGLKAVPDMHWPELIVPAMARRRKTHADDRIQMQAWKACERLLPICERAHGRLSMEVASLLMHQINIYEDLKPGQRDRVAERCVEQAKALQRCAQGALWLADGVATMIWFEQDGEVGAAHVEAEALVHQASAHQDLGDAHMGHMECFPTEPLFHIRMVHLRSQHPVPGCARRLDAHVPLSSADLRASLSRVCVSPLLIDSQRPRR